MTIVPYDDKYNRYYNDILDLGNQPLPEDDTRTFDCAPRHNVIRPFGPIEMTKIDG